LPEIHVAAILIFVIFAGRFLESVIGFGGTVVALPILAVLTPSLPIHTLVPVLALGNIVCCTGIVWVGRKDIVWREYLTIFVYATIGLPIGFLAASYAPEVVLRFILGVFVVIIAFAGIIKNHRRPPEGRASDGPLMRLYLRAVLVMGGIIHGIFTTGGPLLVIYAARALRTKGLFRVTLGLVWLTLNLIMVAGWLLNSQIPAQAWTLAGLTVPFIILAVFVGDHFHHRLPEATFRKVTYVVLCVAGLLLLYKSLPYIINSLMGAAMAA